MFASRILKGWSLARVVLQCEVEALSHSLGKRQRRCRYTGLAQVLPLPVHSSSQPQMNHRCSLLHVFSRDLCLVHLPQALLRIPWRYGSFVYAQVVSLRETQAGFSLLSMHAIHTSRKHTCQCFVFLTVTQSTMYMPSPTASYSATGLAEKM